jgi:hypothetical protein
MLKHRQESSDCRRQSDQAGIYKINIQKKQIAMLGMIAAVAKDEIRLTVWLSRSLRPLM